VIGHRLMSSAPLLCQFMRNGQRALSTTITSLYSTFIASKSSSKERASSTCPENSNSWRIQQLIGELYLSLPQHNGNSRTAPAPTRSYQKEQNSKRRRRKRPPKETRSRGQAHSPTQKARLPSLRQASPQLHPGNQACRAELDRRSRQLEPCWSYNRIRKGQVLGQLEASNGCRDVCCVRDSEDYDKYLVEE
jgi:hypothetical protein